MTKFEALNSSPFLSCVQDGVRVGHWKSELGIYLGFVIWNLGFANAY